MFHGPAPAKMESKSQQVSKNLLNVSANVNTQRRNLLSTVSTTSVTLIRLTIARKAIVCTLVLLTIGIGIYYQTELVYGVHRLHSLQIDSSIMQ